MFGLIALLTSSAFAGNWFAPDGVAASGYDVVAYHTANEAQEGNKKHTAEWDGVTWHFASAANRDAFQKSPEKFAPAFGGYCAFAMAMKDAPVPTNPEQFKLYQGTLLLFFDAQHEGSRMNTSVPWNADEVAMHAKASTNWPDHAK